MSEKGTLNEALRRWLGRPRRRGLKQAALLLRGLLFVGRRHQCSCCGWWLRGFVARDAVLRRSPTGYCPRCNAKARHRRLCLYLRQHPELLGAGSILEVAPWAAVSRFLGTEAKARIVGVDVCVAGPQVTVAGDLTRLPFADASFTLVICTHVLEHVQADRQAMAELVRVLTPGGHAIVSAPLRLDQPTLEDPSVADPEERLRLFGERGHVRWYGDDLGTRLQDAGFAIAMDRADEVPVELRTQFGLREDEHLFVCRKPGVRAAGQS